MRRESLRPTAPLAAYAAVAASNVAATACQYEALRHLSFPLQSLGKCAKTLPALLWGALILRKQYTARVRPPFPPFPPPSR